MSDLPASWRLVQLGEVSNVIRGITFPASVKEASKTVSNVGCLRTTNVQRELDWSDVYFVPRSYVRREEQLVKLGDVLMSMANSYELVGKVAVARSVPFDSAFGAFLAAVRPVPEVTGQFLFHLLRTDHVQRELRKGSSQTTNIANISIKALAAIAVPICPGPEQVRIARKLDAVIARIDACRTKLERVPRILRRFREAVLEAAVSGRLTEEWREDHIASTSGAELARIANDRMAAQRGRRNTTTAAPLKAETGPMPDSWGWTTGAAIVEPGSDIVYGIVQPGPKLAEGVPYVRGTDIQNGKILTPQLLRTSSEIAKRYERASLKGGDVLLGIIRATKVAVVPQELEGANITQGTARFRPSELVSTRYLATVLEAPQTQRWLHDCYRGIDMPGLNLADVRRVPIPLPDIDEQAEIVRRVDELFALADSLERKYRAAVERVEKLTPSVLAKAFRGELVPQDPRDEPADELLKRIRVEKARSGAEAMSRTGVRRKASVRKSGGRPTGPRRRRA